MRYDEESSPLKRFENLLGRLFKVSKQELDDAIEAGKREWEDYPKVGRKFDDKQADR